MESHGRGVGRFIDFLKIVLFSLSAGFKVSLNIIALISLYLVPQALAEYMVDLKAY